jgi:hypothetical protein
MMLSMESPSEVLDYWNDLLERLSEIEIKRVLSLRADFRVADVNALDRLVHIGTDSSSASNEATNNSPM